MYLDNLKIHNYTSSKLNSIIKNNYYPGYTNTPTSIPNHDYDITDNTVFLLTFNNTLNDSCGNTWTYSSTPPFTTTSLPPINGVSHVLNLNYVDILPRGSYVKCDPIPKLVSNPIGTGDYTLDVWIYQTDPSTYTTVYPFCLIGYRPVDQAVNISIPIFGTAIYLYAHRTWREFTSATTLSSWLIIKGWHHYAIVRQSGVGYFYRDGVLKQTTPMTFSTGTGFAFGDEADHNVEPAFLSHYRLSKTALWTSDFTPPGITV